VVHTNWILSNYWSALDVVSNTTRLHPEEVPFELSNFVKQANERIAKTGHAEILVMAMAHWWQSVNQWKKKMVWVDFTQHPHLQLKNLSPKEQMLAVYDVIVKTIVEYLVRNFNGYVIWRTSSSSQYNATVPALDCKNAASITPREEAVQLHNIGDMNDLLRTHIGPILKKHPNHMLLDVADLSLRRKDALAGALGDCTHWCLPGVPDLWNMIMLNSVCADAIREKYK
jgi:hypothetical protein